jgi:hypothetical protein
MGTFVISKRFDDRYKFVFTSRKGKTIFTSSLNFQKRPEFYRTLSNISYGFQFKRNEFVKQMFGQQQRSRSSVPNINLVEEFTNTCIKY